MPMRSVPRSPIGWLRGKRCGVPQYEMERLKTVADFLKRATAALLPAGRKREQADKICPFVFWKSDDRRFKRGVSCGSTFLF